MKKMLTLILIAALLYIFPISASAHSGGTDSQGGHYNRSTGEYHFHHGYSAHNHYDMDGDGDIDCPYDYVDATKDSSTSRTTSSDGYDQGYSDGFVEGSLEAYEIGLEEGYDKGYSDAEVAVAAQLKEVHSKELEEAQRESEKSAYILCAMLGIPAAFIYARYSVSRAVEKAFRAHNAEVNRLKAEHERKINQLILSNLSSDLPDSIDIPVGVQLTTVCLPVKGYANNARPYGDFTVYTSPHGKKYHSRIKCGNATTPHHIYEIPGCLEPCRNCVPKNMLPQAIPEWYLQITNNRST